VTVPADPASAAGGPGPSTPPPLPGDAVGERHRLPQRVVTYWRLRAVITFVVVTGIAAFLAWRIGWWTPQVRWTAVAVIGAVLLVVAAVVPGLRYRTFWYALSPDEIDCQHGILVRTRTVVPMNRVQHLRSERGPLADRFRLASLHIHTAGGEVGLHALDRGEAEAVRTRIAALAHLADDV
jgi:uncharacterized protein